MSLVLSPSELAELTGYEQPCRQLDVLHKRGFSRAFIGRKGVILERVHYEAVSRGATGNAIDKPAVKVANLAFFGGRS